MGTRVAANVAVALVTGCGGYGSEVFQCSPAGTTTQCGPGGMCEPNGFCSVDDPSCVPGGRKYTDHSGSMSGICTNGRPPGEAGIDMPPMTERLCFGNAPFAICLAAAPTTPLVLPTTTPFNTDGNTCADTTSGATGYCVLAGSTISFTGTGIWRATGSKPLVLIASDSITVSATLDVSSRRTANPEAGAGADPTCASPATTPSLGGGGAGGTFTGVGGTGAASARMNSTGGTPATAVANLTRLRGGCPGQDGEGNGKGVGGHGGGAVLLIAVNTINITAGISAAGQGGSAGTQNASGGGGGGAGGMIVLDANTVMNRGLLLANGGGGGEGSGLNTVGADGSDPGGITAASGGSTPTLINGGDGGNGSAGAAAGPGATGVAGITVDSRDGGGGGGGGGAGLIKVSAGATLGTQISPASVSQLP